MNRDPYEAPNAIVSNAQDKNNSKMPISLWFIVAFIVVTLLAKIFVIVKLFPNYLFSVELLMVILIALLCVTSLVMIIKRILWGKWFAVVILTLHLIQSIFRDKSTDIEMFKLSDPNGIGSTLGGYSYYFIFGFLIYKLIFSGRVKDYFEKTNT